MSLIKYEDRKFVKIALMSELKNCPGLIEVYESGNT
jgi:hypothetical protein